MPAVDPAVVAAKLAAKLHADPVDVQDAVDAAIVYVATYTGIAGLGADIPDDALTIEGLVMLGERIFLDSSTGSQSAIGDGSFVPLFTPEDLAAHNHHYWDRLIVSWGVA